jgi:hypothetical protein
MIGQESEVRIDDAVLPWEIGDVDQRQRNVEEQNGG